MQIILFKPYFLEFQWQNCTSPGGRIIDNLQIDNLQIDNRQIDKQNLQIDNLQIDNQQITFFHNSKLITNQL